MKRLKLHGYVTTVGGMPALRTAMSEINPVRRRMAERDRTPVFSRHLPKNRSWHETAIHKLQARSVDATGASETLLCNVLKSLFKMRSERI